MLLVKKKLFFFFFSSVYFITDLNINNYNLSIPDMIDIKFGIKRVSSNPSTDQNCVLEIPLKLSKYALSLLIQIFSMGPSKVDSFCSFGNSVM